MRVIFPSLRSILLSLGAVVAAGTLGAVLGLSGIFAGPTVSGARDPDAGGVSAANCVGGTTFFGRVPAGARVVIQYRNSDTSWVGIRFESLGIGWIPADGITVDPGEPDLSTLPVSGACPEVTLADDPDPEPGPDPAPSPAPDPGGSTDPAPDTTPPTIGVPSISPSVVACDSGDIYPTTGTVEVAASDDRGVSRVEISWSGIVSGSGLMTPGAPYTFVFDPPGGHSGGTVNLRVQAFDEAGNASAQPMFSATVACFG